MDFLLQPLSVILHSETRISLIAGILGTRFRISVGSVCLFLCLCVYVCEVLAMDQSPFKDTR